VALAIPLKLSLSARLLLPLGFVMGMPFPSGLRALAGGATTDGSPAGSTTGNSVEWAWAMNASASVLGSVLAIVIAIRFGLSVTLACGALAYVPAMLMSASLDAGASPIAASPPAAAGA
jgi:hypothetical protein